MRLVESDRGAVFFLCGLAADDLRFPKYPPQPVSACAGFRPAKPPAPEASDPEP